MAATPRLLHTIFYVLFLVTLAVALWFLFHYDGVQPWVWSLFAGAILIAIIGVIIKETGMKRVYDANGKLTNAGSYKLWAILYLIFHILAFIMLIIGFVFVMIQSTVPWWVWVMLAVGVVLVIVSNMVFAFVPEAYIASLIIAIVALVTIVVGFIFLIVYSKAPWWVWMILILAVIFAVLSFIFELSAEKRDIVTCTAPCTTPTASATNPVVTSPTVSLLALPAYNIPEQTVL